MTAAEAAGDGYLDLTLAAFLDRVAAPTAAPGAGAVAATAVALAAGLASMAARSSRRHLDDAGPLGARALALQQRAAPLAQRDADVYAVVLGAQALPEDDPGRSAAVRAALAAAAEVPLEMAEIGVAVLELAEGVARLGNPALRGDALTGALLAQAAVRAAAMLVALNLDDPDDPRRVRAAQLAATAREAGLGELAAGG